VSALDQQALRGEVVTGGWVLELDGQAEMVWGHVSARDPAGRGVWMKSAGIGFDEVTPERVLLVGPDGAVLDGDGRAHLEHPIHTAVLRARPDAGAVVHTHPAHVIALMASGKPLQAFSHTGGIFARPLPVFRDARGLIDTDELGDRMAAALGDHRAVLLDGHGIVTAGASVGLAVMTAVMLERACRLQLLAEMGGGVAAPLSIDAALEAYAHVQPDAHMEGGWRYLARRARASA
jgi:L-fuculose-phosphate aldolase